MDGGAAGHGYVVSGSDDGHILIWDAMTGTVIKMLPPHDNAIPSCVAVRAAAGAKRTAHSASTRHRRSSQHNPSTPMRPQPYPLVLCADACSRLL